MPIRASIVVSDPSFQSDLDGLRETYPAIDDAVEDLSHVLKLGYDLPEISISEQVYTRLVDYPPYGAAGLQQFAVIYHATDPSPSWTDSYQTFTLLAIFDRNPPT